MGDYLTENGLVIRTLQQIKADTETDLRELVHAGIQTAAHLPMGQVIASFSSIVREVWEAVQDVHASFDEAKAEDASQDNIGAISAVPRLGELSSTISNLEIVTDAACTIPSGSLVAVTGDGSRRFVTDTEIVTVAADTFNITATAEFAGPIYASAGTVEDIVNPISGWLSVTSIVDADAGRNVESNTDYRVRRRKLLARRGSTTVDGILSDLSSLDGLVDVNVYENNTAQTDAEGRPAYSVEIVIYDGSALGTVIADDTIADALWDSRAAGQLLYGQDSGEAVDLIGGIHRLPFSRPIRATIYIDLVVQVDPAKLSGFDVSTVKDQIANNNTLLPGEDVTADHILCVAAATQDVIGVPIATVFIGLTGSPTLSTTLELGVRTIAYISTTNITVTAV